MKNTKFLYALSIVVLSLSIISCSDDNDPQTYKVPVKLEYESGNSLKYEYDNKLHLIKMEFKDMEKTITADIIYNTQEKISMISISMDEQAVGNYEFTYTGNILSVNPSEGNVQTIETNDNGQLIRISGYKGPDHEFRYIYDSNGNISEEASYVNEELTHKTFYNYDNQNGYSKNVDVPVWIGYYLGLNILFPGKINNEVNESHYLAKEDKNESGTKAEYVYDNEDYPISATYSIEGIIMNKLTIVYESRMMK